MMGRSRAASVNCGHIDHASNARRRDGRRPLINPLDRVAIEILPSGLRTTPGGKCTPNEDDFHGLVGARRDSEPRRGGQEEEGNEIQAETKAGGKKLSGWSLGSSGE